MGETREEEMCIRDRYANVLLFGELMEVSSYFCACASGTRMGISIQEEE